jgi:Fur family ferric uptake transcriptional regulator
MRITKSLRMIVEVLLEATEPQSLAGLESHSLLKGLCDPATIYRTLQRLESAGLLRKLRYSEQAAKFTFDTGKNHKEYLICTECGDVKTLSSVCPVKALEQKISDELGYGELHHELTFYGKCKHCLVA